MYLQYQLMKTLQDERLRSAARDHLAAEVRRARTASRDHTAATRARGMATMPGKQGAIIGLGIPAKKVEGKRDRRPGGREEERGTPIHRS